MINNKTRLVLIKNESYFSKNLKLYKLLKIIGFIFLYLFLIIAALVALFPFYWMIISSLKYEEEIIKDSTTFFPTMGIAWSNYSTLFLNFNFGKYILNTLINGVISLFGTFFITIFAAYAFAREKFIGRDIIFFIFLSTMMIPSELFVTANFISVYRLGLTESRLGTYLAQLLPFIVNVFYIYLLRENFRQVPEELYLAAKIDGKSDWKYLWKVLVPMCSNTLIMIIILKIISTWNSYAWPNVLLPITNSDYTLISVAIKMEDIFLIETPGGFVQSTSLEMAATVVITIPLILIFVIFRKFIMRGVGKAGIKG